MQSVLLSGSANYLLLSYLGVSRLHYSYGYGYFRGLLSLFIRKRKMHLIQHKVQRSPVYTSYGGSSIPGVCVGVN